MREQPRRMGGRERRDSGASAIEYGALISIGAVLIVMLALLVPNPVGPAVKKALCDLFRMDCAAENYDYKPPASACITGLDSKKAGYSVTAFSIKVGQNFQFVKTTYADGKVRIMIVPADYKLGAEAEIGGKVQFGKKSFGGELGAKVEGSVNFKYGDTWVFNSDKEAGEWLDDVKWDLARKEGEKVSPGLWLYDTITGWEPRTRDPEITQWEVGAEGVLKGAAGFGNLTTDSSGKKTVKDTATGLEIEGSAGDAVLVTKDNTGSEKDGYPKTTYTFQVKGTLKGGAKAFGYGPGGERTYIGQTRVTYDKNGRLTGITWITTQETNDSEGYKNPGKKNVSGKDTDKQVSTTTTTVNFDDSNRAIGENWIRNNAFLMPFQTVRNAADENGAFVAQDPGPNADPLDQLIYSRGLVNRNVYAGNVDEFKIGAEIAAEIKFGIEGGYEGEQQQIVDSQYLGPPQNGQRTFQQWPECAK
ncbi:flagellin [Actinomadura madurae]|uniref:flagellin n=2 Tax=Actinomadura madurae TaxID=1993 RepID=UPI0020D20D24|nr:flagellin [Actinomadura madurae]MCP9950185.1 flagellin [Actinomadura madurae]MCP9966953.1 flagellin [Actinomadura madurae]MCP9979424.1 flagellin [Actinomadura madurae]MCQ0009047.1 flagellin [Actinomadura madurae]MCQ0015631.1 flagellin [Actinomadura madurae]